MLSSYFSRLNYHKFFVIAFVIVYLAIPKSLEFDYNEHFKNIPEYLTLWRYQRLILLGGCLLYLIVYLVNNGPTWKELLFFLVCSALGVINFFEGNFVSFYAVIGSSAAYVLVKNSGRAVFNKRQLWVILLIMLIYPLQYLIYRLHGRTTASFIDANISGYYLFLVYAVYRLSGLRFFKFLALFILPLGFFSLSRNFLLAVLVFEASKYFITPELARKLFISGVLRAKNLLMVSTAAIIIVSIYLTTSPTVITQSSGSVDRLLNIQDGSNYYRAMANISTIKRIFYEGDFLVYGNGTEMDAESTHRPHNALLRAVYRYGIPIAILSLIPFFFVLDKFVLSLYPLVVSLFCYYSLLNDFITGSELFFISCILIILKSLNDLRSEEIIKVAQSPSRQILR